MFYPSFAQSRMRFAGEATLYNYNKRLRSMAGTDSNIEAHGTCSPREEARKRDYLLNELKLLDESCFRFQVFSPGGDIFKDCLSQDPHASYKIDSGYLIGGANVKFVPQNPRDYPHIAHIMYGVFSIPDSGGETAFQEYLAIRTTYNTLWEYKHNHPASVFQQDGIPHLDKVLKFPEINRYAANQIHISRQFSRPSWLERQGV